MADKIIVRGIVGKVELAWWFCEEGHDTFELFAKTGGGFYLRPFQLEELIPLFERDVQYDATPLHKKLVCVTSLHKGGECTLIAEEQLEFEEVPRQYITILTEEGCARVLDFIRKGRSERTSGNQQG